MVPGVQEPMIYQWHWQLARMLPQVVVTKNGAADHLPSTVTLSTDSCRLLPRRTTLTVCHSLSLSLCPAKSVSGPLPAAPRGE